MPSLFLWSTSSELSARTPSHRSPGALNIPALSGLNTILSIMAADDSNSLGTPTVKEKTADHSEDWVEHSTEGAKAANLAEHELTVRQALYTHRWAVAWSLLISASIIMEGYDTVLINNFLAYPAFRKRFGQYHQNSGYQVSGRWQSALSAGSQAGAVIGAFINGIALKRFGFKIVFMVSLVVMCACIFPSFFGKNVQAQLAGQILCRYVAVAYSFILLCLVGALRADQDSSVFPGESSPLLALLTHPRSYPWLSAPISQRIRICVSP